jgi:hypothetical protein
MRAEEILALGRPALLPLIGQTRIVEPAEIIPRAVAAIGRVEPYGQRVRLFTALTGLMRDEEVLQMTERLIEAMGEGLLVDTPYLRRIREKSRAEGRDEGLAAAIANVLATRFDLSMRAYHQLEQRLLVITDAYRLQALLQTAVLTPDVASFEQALER